MESDHLNKSIPDVTLVRANGVVCQLPSYLREASALVLIYVPYCFGSASPGTIFQFLNKVNDCRSLFEDKDIRVLCITRYLTLHYNSIWLAISDS